MKGKIFIITKNGSCKASLPFSCIGPKAHTRATRLTRELTEDIELIMLLGKGFKKN